MGEKPSKVLTRSFMCTGLFNEDQGAQRAILYFYALMRWSMANTQKRNWTKRL